jgi:hypothetical protein
VTPSSFIYLAQSTPRAQRCFVDYGCGGSFIYLAQSTPHAQRRFVDYGAPMNVNYTASGLIAFTSWAITSHRDAPMDMTINL